jgi:hypothetical protein
MEVATAETDSRNQTGGGGMNYPGRTAGPEIAPRHEARHGPGGLAPRPGTRSNASWRPLSGPLVFPIEAQEDPTTMLASRAWRTGRSLSRRPVPKSRLGPDGSRTARSFDFRRTLACRIVIAPHWATRNSHTETSLQLYLYSSRTQHNPLCSPKSQDRNGRCTPDHSVSIRSRRESDPASRAWPRNEPDLSGRSRSVPASPRPARTSRTAPFPRGRS